MAYNITNGESRNGIILKNDSMVVLDGGIANSTTVNSFGYVHISSGGTANSASINELGFVYVSSGGIANNTTANYDGYLSVTSGGIANNTTIRFEGWCYVYNSAVANNVTVCSKGLLGVASGGTATNIIASTGAIIHFDVTPGTYIQGTSGGSAFVINDGFVSNFSVRSDCSLRVYSHGLANNTIVNPFGSLSVLSGGTVNNTTVNSNGSLFVSGGGTANSITISPYGNTFISSGGTVNSTTLNSGGRLVVSRDGIANNITINSGGRLEVSSGGSATNITWTPCVGQVRIEDGAYATFSDQFFGVYYGLNEHLLSSAMMMEGQTISTGSAYIMANGIMENGSVGNSSGFIYVLSGGNANNTEINYKGKLEVSSGGIANTATVNSGGTLQIFGNGTAYDIVANQGAIDILSRGAADTVAISSGGYLSVSSLGIVSNAIIYNSGKCYLGGGEAKNAVISSGGSLAIYAGGKTNDAKVMSGGSLFVSSGGKANETKMSGGSLVVFSMGAANDTYVENGSVIVSRSGIASNVTMNWGRFWLSSGGTALNPTINKGGYLYVLGGGTATDIEENGGYLSIADGAEVFIKPHVMENVVLDDEDATVHSGTTANSTTVSSNCRLLVYSGGVADNTLVTGYNFVGGLRVYSGGTANSTNLISRGVFYLEYNGTATHTTVGAGGEFFIFENASATEIIENGGFVKYSSGATVSFAPNVFSGVVASSNHGVTIHSGTTGIDTTIYSCSIVVYSGGIASNTTAYNSGNISVSSGGTADKVILKGGGGLTVFSGGIANSVMVNKGGLSISSGGTASLAFNPWMGTVVSNAGATVTRLERDKNVYYGGSYDGLISSADALAELTVNSGQCVNIYENGVLENTVVSNGTINLSSGGKAINLSFYGGEYYINGNADNTTINTGSLYVSSGGTANNTIADSTGINVYSGGVVNSTTLNQCGLHVDNGGVANDTTVNSGCFFYVLGIASGATIKSSGYIGIYSGAKLTGCINIEAGAIVSFQDETVFDFDLTHISAGSPACINDLSLVHGNPLYTITVLESGQEFGTFILADGVNSFDKTVSLQNTNATIGTLEVGKRTRFKDADYKLLYMGERLSLLIDEQDLTAPIVNNICADITTPTNQDVLVTADFTDNVEVESSFYKVGDGLWIPYIDGVIVSNNETVFFKAIDESGNVSEIASYSVTNIDKTPPANPDVTPSASFPTNTKVAVSASFSTDSVIREYSYDSQTWYPYSTPIVFSENGMVFFRGTDVAGNISDVTCYEVANIDKHPPESPKVSANTILPTNKDVIITAEYSPDSERREYSFDKINWIPYKNNVVMANNGNVYFRGLDVAGNVSEVTEYFVCNIDREAPNLPVISADIILPTNQDVTITASFSEDTALKEYSFDGYNWFEYGDSVIVVANGIIYFRGTDEAGNSSPQVSFSVENIDKNPPIIMLTGNSDSLSQSTLLTAVTEYGIDIFFSTENFAWSKYESPLETIDGIVYYFQAKDAVGNVGTAQCAIDRTPPEAPIVSADITSPTNQDVIVYATFSEDTVSKEYSIDGTSWLPYQNGVTMTQNGGVYFRGTDLSGNISKETLYLVDNIDKIAPPKPSVSADITTPTYGNVTVSAVYSLDSFKKEYSFDSINWMNYTNGVVLYNNGTVYFRGIDIAGNISELATCNVSNISRTISSGRTITNDSSLYVSAGYIFYNTNAWGWGHVNVLNGGIAINTTVTSRSSLNVSSGGIVDSATIKNSCWLDVHSGGTAMNVIASKGAQIELDIASNTYFQGVCDGTSYKIDMRSSSSISNCVFNRIFDLNFYSSEIAFDNNTLLGGSATVYRGGKTTRTTIDSKGQLSVGQYGIAESTTVNPTGSLFVSSRGSATDIIENGGFVYVDYAAFASFSQHSFSNTILSSGQSASIHSGTTGNSITINPQATLYVYSGGTALDVIWTPCNGIIKEEEGAYITFASHQTGAYYGGEGILLSKSDIMENLTIENRNELYVMSNALTNSTTISSGGKMYVSSGGTANNLVICHSGFLRVTSGGTAAHIVANTGALLDFSVAPNSYIEGSLNDSAFEIKNGTAIAYSINSGSVLRVSSGGQTSRTYVYAGGKFFVSAGGFADATSLSDGNMIIESKGGATNTSIKTGILHINNGGVTSDTTISRGSLFVNSGGSANNTIVSSGGYMYFSSGCNASNVLARNGAYLGLVVAKDTYIQGTSNGLSFEMKDAYLSGLYFNNGNLTVYSGGLTNHITVAKGGAMLLNSNGIAYNTVVNSGNLTIFEGGYASDVVLRGFYSSYAYYGQISNAGVIDNVSVESAGHYYVSYGGVANGTIVNSGGAIIVSAGAIANSTIVNSGGYMSMSSKSIACDIRVNRGGQLSFQNKITGKIVIESGASVYAGVGANIDFDISRLAPGTDGPRVNNLSMIKADAPAFSLTVSNLQWNGMYVLANGVSIFDSLISVKTSTSNETVQMVAIGETVNIDGVEYTLGLMDSTLIVTVTGGRDLPVIPISADVTGLTNQDVILTAGFSDNAIMREYSYDNETWYVYTEPVKCIENGTVYFLGKDQRGYVNEIASYEIKDIDKTPPNKPTATADISAPTNGSVTVTATFSEDSSIKEFSFDEQTWNAYTVPVILDKNGSVFFRGIDEAGNISVVTVYIVSNIDTTAPDKPGVSADITKDTNTDVTVSAVFSEDSVIKEYSLDGKTWLLYTDGVVVSDNCTVLFRGTDEAGNVSEIATYTVTNIDRIAPEKPVASADISEITNTNVMVSAVFSDDSVLKEYSLDGTNWRTYTAPLPFSQNGVAYFRGTDAAGNTSEPEIYTVSNIDKVAPDKPVATADVTVPTNEAVHVSAIFNDKSAVKEYSLNGNDWLKYEGSIELVENGTVYFRSTDAVGNVSEVTIYEVNNIDRVAPYKPTVSADVTETTYGSVNVSAVFSGDSVKKEYSLDNGDTWQDYTAPIEFTANGIVLFRGTDAADNVSEVASYEVANIETVIPDTTKPTVTNAKADITVATNQNVTVTADFADDTELAQSLYRIGEAGQWMDYIDSVIVSENATVYFKAVDAAGNESEVIPYTVGNIDKVAPSAPSGLMAVVSDPTTVLIWSPSTDNASGIKEYIVKYSRNGQEFTATVNNTNYVLTGLASGSWAWSVQAVDIAGNESALTVGNSFDIAGAVVEPVSDIAPQTQTWEKTAENTKYIVELSSDEGHAIQLVVDSNSLDSFQIPAGNYQMRVKPEGGEWSELEPVVASEASTEPKLVKSNEDGNADVFFVNSIGTWEADYVAQHVGSTADTWGGTNEYVALFGKNKLADIIEGSTDANILLMTDDDNGDALFVDDIYSALPGSVTEQQSRIAQIDEIRAGAGDDIVDMTSQRFEYIGEGLTIRGGEGNDIIWANKGDNWLFGDAGNDRIVGASGNDVIAGGIDNDRMHGGGGSDIFTFCDNWGVDNVEQLAGGSVTLWFESGSMDNWDSSSLTYTDGDNSVKVSGVTAEQVKLKFGDDGSDQFASLTSMGAFFDATTERIFEESGKGILASL